jgi:hypothetical protein
MGISRPGRGSSGTVPATVRHHVSFEIAALVEEGADRRDVGLAVNIPARRVDEQPLQRRHASPYDRQNVRLEIAALLEEGADGLDVGQGVVDAFGRGRETFLALLSSRAIRPLLLSPVRI